MFYINDNADEQLSFLGSLPGAGTAHTFRGIVASLKVCSSRTEAKTMIQSQLYLIG